jgi:hypothetical protein
MAIIIDTGAEMHDGERLQYTSKGTRGEIIGKFTEGLTNFVLKDGIFY